MPKQQTVLQVFVGSPSDVQEERAVLEEEVRDINLVLGSSGGMPFELIKWETHSYPGFGDDAQDVINKQIPDDYDVFIGIMWSRFGTPTNRSESGTEEEFLRAYKRYKERPADLNILLYFKTAAIPVNDIDTDQLALVKKFKDQVPDLGGFYQEFSDLNSFRRLVRIHLHRVAKEWSERSSPELKNEMETGEEAIKPDQNSKSHIPGTESEDAGDYGLLDYLEIFDESFSRVNEITERMAASTELLGNRITKRVQQFSEIQESDSQDLKSVKKVTNLAAQDMDAYADEIEPQIHVFEANFGAGVDAMMRAMDITAEDQDYDIKDIEESASGVRNLRENMSGAKDSLSELMETIITLPRITKEFNRAKRRATLTLEMLIQNLEQGSQVAAQLEDTLTSMIHK